jgi:hypothetical protein
MNQANTFVHQIFIDDLRKDISELMKACMVSIGQAAPPVEHFEIWRREFSEHINKIHGNKRFGCVLNFFEQIKSGAIVAEKINSRSMISMFDKHFRKSNMDNQSNWQDDWNNRTSEQKAWDRLGADVYGYRYANPEHKSTHTWEQSVKMMQAGEIKPVKIAATKNKINKWKR